MNPDQTPMMDRFQSYLGMGSLRGMGVMDRSFREAQWFDPESIGAEQCRVLYTRLNRDRNRGPIRLLTVSSSIQGEGKTTISMNLALVVARDFGLRTLLVDADLKKTSLSRSLGMPADGWVEAISGSESLDRVIQPVAHENLFFMAASGPIRDSIRVISSEKLAVLLNELKQRFDMIILDGPPVVPLADMNRYAELSDGILMVVRAGVTRMSFLKQALSSLDQHRSKIVGTVLSRVGASELSSIYSWPE